MQLFETLARNRERCIAATMEATGWTREYTEEQIAYAREQMDVLFRDYTEYEFYTMSPEQQRETYQEILNNRRK